MLIGTQARQLRREALQPATRVEDGGGGTDEVASGLLLGNHRRRRARPTSTHTSPARASVTRLALGPPRAARHAHPVVGGGGATPTSSRPTSTTSPASGGHTMSAGHEADVPSQTSSGSQASSDGLQEMPSARKESGGQVAWLPLHVSATSQLPAGVRHTTPARYSGTQSADVPEQWSGASHVSSVEGAHSTSGLAKVGLQKSVVPSQ